MAEKLMSAKELIEIALEIAERDTVYAKGCWGQELTQKLLDAKRGQSDSMRKWYDAKSKVEPKMSNYQRLSGLAGDGCRAYDCVCLIKGIAWGSRVNAAGTYATNGVADVTADTLYKNTAEQTTPDKAEPGMVLHMSNHVGIYIGDGKVVEAAPSLGKVGVTDITYQRWSGAGKLPWVDYSENCAGATSGSSSAVFAAGDKVTIKAGAKYGGAAKGKAVPSKYTDGDVFTVSKVQKNNGVLEALLKELTSWVPVSSLAAVPVVAEVVKTVEKRTVCNCSWLNVRQGPGTSYKVVTVLKAGTVVEVQEISKDWCRIGKNRWVSSKFLW